MNKLLTRSVATAALTAVITALMPGGSTARPIDEGPADAAPAQLLAATVIEIPIAVTTDDAIEGGGATGTFVDTGSADNEFGNNGAATPVEVMTGLRFPGIPAPAGSEIVSAKIQFQVDEAGSDPASYTIYGHADDNAPTFGGSGNISGRPATTAQVSWAPPPWTVIGAHGPDQQTPELKSIVQEIVDRPGWAEGNAVAFVVDGAPGTGRRTAEAFGGTAAAPPVLRLEYQVTAPNTPPVVSAGPDRAITLPASASLNGTVTDDGLPNPPGVTTQTWTKQSGPGDVIFGAPNLPTTSAEFSAPGTYVLRLTASDSDQSAFDEVTVTVEPAEIPNAPPTANAGTDQTITLPASANLNGTVTDDNLPNPPGETTTTWSKVSGPGDVTFGNPAAADTTATFSQAGTYVLRLTADDSLLAVFDDVTVTVNPAEIPNTAPTVDAGPANLTVTLPDSASLNGTVTDDNLPNPPGATTTTWSEASGPGTVTFGDPAAVETTATFSAAGTYVLRLTADDGALQSSDDVTVTVNPAETPNAAPVVNAGPNRTVRMPNASANLNGNVTDDGLPSPPAITTTWSKVDGPGNVTFDNANAVDTTATFSATGSYILRLTADDGALQAHDDVTVTVQPQLAAPELTATLERQAILAGSTTRVKGTLSPAVAQTPVHLQRWMGGKWVRVQRTTLPAGASRNYAFVVRPGVSGTYRYRVMAPAHAGRPQTIAPDNPLGMRLFVYNAQITRVKPQGDEFVVIRNSGKVSLNLAGWRLRNNANGRVVTLPSRSLVSGGWVRVHTGSGRNGGHDLYLGKRPMWGEHGTAVLRDNRTLLVDQRRY
jgi:Lamin Tail Domain